MSDGQKVVLVVANETLIGDELIAAVRRRAEQGPIRVVIVAPVNEPSAGYVVYEDSRRAAAGRRLDRTVEAFRAAGIPAHGGVFAAGPLDAVKDIVAQEHIDELIVSTHPEAKSGLAAPQPDRRDSQGRGRPAGRARGRRRRSAHGRGQRARGRERDRARRAAARAHPASRLGGPDELPASSARRATPRRPSIRRPSGGCAPRSSQLRADGVDAHGQIAHPDPYTAAMQAHPRRADRRGDRVHVPGRAVGVAATRSRRPTARRLEAPGRARRRRPGARWRWPHERARRGAARARGRPPRAARREQHLAARRRRSSGCSSSSAPRRCCSARSSPRYFFVRVVNPTAPETWPPAPYEFPKFVAGINTADARHVELHDALGAAVDQAQQPPRPPGGPGAHDPDGHAPSCSPR